MSIQRNGSVEKGCLRKNLRKNSGTSLIFFMIVGSLIFACVFPKVDKGVLNASQPVLQLYKISESLDKKTILNIAKTL